MLSTVSTFPLWSSCLQDTPHTCCCLVQQRSGQLHSWNIPLIHCSKQLDQKHTYCRGHSHGLMKTPQGMLRTASHSSERRSQHRKSRKFFSQQDTSCMRVQVGMEFYRQRMMSISQSLSFLPLTQFLQGSVQTSNCHLDRAIFLEHRRVAQPDLPGPLLRFPPHVLWCRCHTHKW
jgi:hypothetical protein